MRTPDHRRGASALGFSLGLSFALGCSFHGPGGGSGTNGLGDESGDEGTSGGLIPTASTSMSAGTMGGSSDPTDPTMDPTMDPSTDPTMDPTMTGDADASDTAPQTDTGGDPTGPVSGSTDTGDGSASAEDGASSTGEMGPEPYAACADPAPDCTDPEVCIVLANQSNVVASWCAETGCGSEADCPTPSTGNATKVCVDQDGGFCVLSCGGGETCPNGMDCYAIQNNLFRCAWPD